MSTPHAPTNVRWYVIAVTTLMSVLLYLDRFCVSTAEIYIKEDLGLTDTQIGWIVSGFFWAYALAQVGTGWLADRFGARTMLTLYIVTWSLFTALLGAAAGFVSLLVLRLGIGVAQAGAYPAGVGVVRNWMPFHRRAVGSGWVTFGGRVGGTLAIFLTGYVILMFVPSSVKSELQPGDVLRPHRWCHALVHGKATPQPGAADPVLAVAERLTARLSPSSRDWVEQIAAPYQAADKAARAELELRPVDAAMLDNVLREINALLGETDLLSEIDLSNLPVENEARRLAPRRDSLSADQTVRLNRLIVEAAFRDSIRKVYVAGWRATMMTYGGVGFLVAALFWFVHRDQPHFHPRCNDAERELIRPGGVEPPRAANERLPLRRLVTDRSMWMNCLMQFTTNVGWIFLLTLTPRYFEEVHHVPLEQRVWMAAIPSMFGWLGMLLGGGLTDRLTARIGLRWGRMVPVIVTRVAATLIYLGCLVPLNPWVAVAAFSLIAFLVDLAIPAVWAFQQDVGGRYVGSVLGWGNMWGNFGAAVAPVVSLWMLDATHSWNAVFLFGAVAFLVSGLAALGIDATRPIQAE